MKSKLLIVSVTLALTAIVPALKAQQWNTNTLPFGLIAWWSAEGSAVDATANHHDGTASGGVSYVSGQFGSGIAFDGTNGVVEVPDNPALRLTNALTIEFWAKRQRFGIDFVLEKGGDWNSTQDGEANYGVSFHSGNNHMLYFTFRGGWRGISGVSDFDWHHYAVVATNGSANPAFYIDGLARPVEFSEGAGTVNLFPSARPLHLGAQLSPNWNYYGNNVLDEVRLYNRALTPTEIAAVAGQLHTIKLMAMQNAQIDSDTPNTPFEEWGILDANSTRRILLQFDFSSLPVSASITSATLGLVSRAPYNYVYSGGQTIWRVENDTWNQSFVTWNSFVSGTTDFLAEVNGGVGQQYIIWDLNLSAWNPALDLADDRLSLLVIDDPGMSYYSRAVPNPNNGSTFPDSDIVPYLEITYAGNPPLIPPPLIQVSARTTNQLTLVWNTFPGWSYQLQASAALEIQGWLGVTATNYASELFLTNTVATGTNAQQFFRVRQFSR